MFIHSGEFRQSKVRPAIRQASGPVKTAVRRTELSKIRVPETTVTISTYTNVTKFPLVS